jgi:hypothetical protein
MTAPANERSSPRLAGRRLSAPPPNEKPLKLEMGFEEAVQRFMQSPPMPKDTRRKHVPRKSK